MYCNIILDPENEEVLRSAHYIHKKIYNYAYIIVKCVYFIYPEKILKNTLLPKVLTNLVCDYVNDEIAFKINIKINKIGKLRFKLMHFISEDATSYINFKKVPIKLIIKHVTSLAWDDYIEYIHLLKLDKNILMHNRSTNSNIVQEHTYEAIQSIIRKIKNEEYQTKYITSYIPNETMQFEIVDYEVILIICNIIHTIIKTIKQMN